ncbi:MAG: hypothetical protein KC766_38210 [Myxococcales bacterium]|nr:hypothetical protein [Myxococcales bacterium]
MAAEGKGPASAEQELRISEPPPSDSGSSGISRWGLVGLPACSVLVVAFALFVVGAPRPYVAARLFGGPLEGQSEYHLRLEVAERLGELESPRRLGLQVHARSDDGREASWGGTTDPQGNAEVDLAFDSQTQGPLALTVTLDQPQAELPAGYVLARGKVTAPERTWRDSVHVGETWTQRSRGELRLRVAPARGVFAVPFHDGLFIEVTRKGSAVAGADLQLSLEGATWLEGGEEGGERRHAVSDERGRVRAELVPDSHVITLEVKARLEQPQGEALTGRLAWRLPVIPGALNARVEGSNDAQSLVISSPVERDRAYVTLLDREGRWGGGSVGLQLAADGNFRGRWSLPENFRTDNRWALVSSESDFTSAGAVGWPLSDSDEAPQPTLSAREMHLLDGFPAAYARDRSRIARARWLAIGVALLSGALMLVLLVRRAQESQRKLAEHLRRQQALGNVEQGADSTLQAPRYSLTLVLALICVGLAFLMLGLLVLYRAH